MNGWIQDVRFAVRLMRRNPAMTFLALATMMLGIGANTAVFSLVDGVLLRPLDYPDSERLYSLRLRTPSHDSNNLSVAEYLGVAQSNESFEGVSIYASGGFGLGSAEGAQAVRGASVDTGFFTTLGVRPALGRAFHADEGQPADSRVAVLDHDLWRTRFSSDPSILGTTILLDAAPYQVIGVLPEHFRFPAHSTPAVIVPFVVEPPTRRGPFYLNGVARLKESVSPEAMRAELAALVSRIQSRYSSEPARWSFEIVPLHERLVRHSRETLTLLLGAVGLVLLIACVNVANLLLSRGAARGREMAVRSGMGASGMRLARQLMTESLLLSTAGGIAGIGLAWMLLRALPTAHLLPGYTGLRTVGLDLRVLAFTLAATCLSGILFGLVPALQSARRDVVRPLNEGGRSQAESRGGRRLRSGLVVVEFALAMLLLVGGGLLIKTSLQLRQADPGFDPRNLLTASVSVPGRGTGLFSATSDEAEIAQRRDFFDRLVEETRALPGVSAVGLAGGLPPDEYWFANDLVIRESPLEAGQSPPVEICNVVDPYYFEALGIRVVQGRGFLPAGEPRDASIVDEAFVRKYFPDGIGVGKHIRWAGAPEDSSWSEIVGVVENVRHAGLDTDFQPIWYMPRTEFSPPPAAGYLVIRTQADPRAVIPSLRGLVRELNPQAPLDRVMTMEERLSASVAQPRFRALLMLFFAGAALLLAAVGIYGVISYSVAQRRREVGIRMALGADRRQVFGQVIGSGIRLAAAGLVLGVVASLALSRLLEGMLHSVSPFDPVTIIAVSAVLFAVAAAACTLPTLRATRIDPVSALRQD